MARTSTVTARPSCWECDSPKPVMLCNTRRYSERSGLSLSRFARSAREPTFSDALRRWLRRGAPQIVRSQGGPWERDEITLLALSFVLGRRFCRRGWGFALTAGQLLV